MAVDARSAAAVGTDVRGGDTVGVVVADGDADTPGTAATSPPG
ncbi:MAG TPA: hypothetical protein VEQ66_09585 [Propionibacteriaceae bacterium]|nr:hypothetical protein [Propionibacteriaceae bacterium]